MNTKRTMLRTAFAATASLAMFAAANAGAPRHIMPADYGRTHLAYEFKVVGTPSPDAPFVVQLLNTATGQPVVDAHVTMQHTVWLGLKAMPQVQRALVAMESDGKGNYVCADKHGGQIVLRAQVPGESSGTWFTVAANN